MNELERSQAKLCSTLHIHSYIHTYIHKSTSIVYLVKVIEDDNR